MADRMSNIAGLFREGRTRTILLTTFIVLVIAIVAGIFAMRGRTKGVEASAGLTVAPGNIQNVPFVTNPNPEYVRTQEKQNIEAAKVAEQRGGSAIPTIIRAENDTGPAQESTSIGFTALSREQSDTGTFSAKEFAGGATKNCPIVPAVSPLGTPVYDKSGRLIGYAATDGKVRDANGNVIGSMGPDGLVRDASGAVIGQKSSAITGTPVYDAKCNIMGYVDQDGNIKDTAGARVGGAIGADGAVRDPSGKILGHVAVPVYDSNGKLMGYACADGKLRDISGSVLGTVGTDGIARDLNGNIIGKAGAISPGTIVYDANGNAIGSVGPDGKVRDANGNVIGALGVDGLLRDAQGNIIGGVANKQQGAATAGHEGTPVYDANGNLIGYAGSDGKVRGLNGNLMGTLGTDGKAKDANGNIIGTVGTPVYDANGNLIGYAGSDGKVRDLTGNVIGSAVYGPNGNLMGYAGTDGKVHDLKGKVIGALASDGKVRDALGNIIGSNQKQPLTPEQIAAQNIQASYDRQQAILKDQRLTQEVQQKQQGMSSQANQLMSAWTQLSGQQYVVGNPPESNAGEGGGSSASNGSASGSQTAAAKASGPVFIKAGTVYFGIINTAINSDEPGPVMASILNGPYKGAKLLGTLTNQGKAVLISFNTMTLPQFSKSISINAVAIDQNTARTSLSTETDNHYWLRYGSLFAAALVQGYAQATIQSGATTSVSVGPGGASAQTQNQPLSGRDKLFAAIGNVGTQWGAQMSSVYSTPPTVYVASGTAVGVLFMADVTLPTS